MLPPFWPDCLFVCSFNIVRHSVRFLPKELYTGLLRITVMDNEEIECSEKPHAEFIELGVGRIMHIFTLAG